MDDRQKNIIGKLKRDVVPIYRAAIDAVSPRRAVLDHCALRNETLIVMSGGEVRAQYRLDEFGNIIVLGAGKATAPMAAAMEEILGERISRGMICVKEGYGEVLRRIRVVEASHPVPDERGLAAAREMLAMLGSAGKNDLVISLISGGGSSLLPLPPEGVSLEDKRTVTDLLLRCGAPIGEMNAVRKHLSLIKGGLAAKAAYPAGVLNLMISDVVGNDPSVIASGLFVPDETTFGDVLGIIEKYGIAGKVPETVMGHLRRGQPETPGKGDPCFKGITNLVIASNEIALAAAKGEAEHLGYAASILSSAIEGDTAECARMHARVARDVVDSGVPLEPPCCILSGGETTVHVTGDGLGGRNMEFALQAAPLIDGLPVVIASVGTDGTDGPTDAAGALAAGDTMERAGRIGLDIGRYLERNDSYHFFEALDDRIVTGPTNTNVMDVRIVMAGR